MCSTSIIPCAEISVITRSSVTSSLMESRGAVETWLGSRTRSSALRFPAAFAFLCEKITQRQPGVARLD